MGRGRPRKRRRDPESREKETQQEKPTSVFERLGPPTNKYSRTTTHYENHTHAQDYKNRRIGPRRSNPGVHHFTPGIQHQNSAGHSGDQHSDYLEQCNDMRERLAENRRNCNQPPKPIDKGFTVVRNHAPVSTGTLQSYQESCYYGDDELHHWPGYNVNPQRHKQYQTSTSEEPRGSSNESLQPSNSFHPENGNLDVMKPLQDTVIQMKNAMNGLLKKSPDEIVVALHQTDLNPILFEACNTDKDLLQLIISAVASACKSTCTKLLTVVLKSLLVWGFFENLNVHKIILNVISTPSVITKSNVRLVISLCEIVKEIFQYCDDHIRSVLLVLVLLDGLMSRLNDCSNPEVEELHKMHSELKHCETMRNDHLADVAADEQRQKLTESIQGDRPLLKVEDILDTSDRFMPSNDVRSPYRNLKDYLQVHFKLLHEDFLQPLRNGFAHYKSHRDAQKSNQRFRDFDIKVYDGVKVVSKKYSPFDGILFTVQVEKKQLQQNSRKLIFGSLMCLLNKDLTNVIFMTVAGKDDTKNGLLDLRLEAQDMEMPSLFDADFIMIESNAFYRASKFVLEGLRTLHNLDIAESCHMMKYFAYTIINVKPPSFLAENPDMQYNFSCLMTDAEPQAKTTRDLHSEDPKKFCLGMPSSWPSQQQLGIDSSQYQALKTALTKEISVIQGPPGTGKSFLGTKIVQLLIRNRYSWCDIFDAGPILVICYTNHALDQFLEEIIQLESRNLHSHFMVRVGSRSESDCLKRWNLNTLRQELSPRRRKREPSLHLQSKNRVFYLSNELQRKQFHLRETRSGILELSFLFKGNNMTAWESLNRLGLFDVWFVRDGCSLCQQERTARRQSRASEKVEEVDVEDVIESCQRKLDVDESFDDSKEELVHGSNQAFNFNNDFPHPDQTFAKEATAVAKYLLETMCNEKELPVWYREKYDGYLKMWNDYSIQLRKHQEKLQKDIASTEEQFQKALVEYQEIRDMYDIEILKKSSIIGMTTTGAATCRKVLSHVSPKIIVVEEAAEILEAHVISSLSKDCQQLIMIGDHKQLRPKPNVYKLEKEPYNLGVSLFEKLIRKGMNVDQLKLQHRMRPEFRDLLVPDIYKELLDHDSVQGMENVRGMKYNYYFLNHNHLENDEPNSASHANEYEAQFLVDFCEYLLKQGYSEKSLTLLSTYRGQTRCIRKLIEFHHDARMMKVCNTAIDNYQGEENDIVLLSLVRSNKEKRIGFMNEDTRICVALSRAKYGLFVVGNLQHFASKSKTWQNILHKAKVKGHYGSNLTLQCDNHDAPVYTEITCPKDFQTVPDGGCSQPCGIRLDCGHECPHKCHRNTNNHSDIVCQKQCVKLCGEGHTCRKKCFERCGACEEFVEKIIPMCGHSQKVACSIPPENYLCKERCQETLQCGHKCKGYCGVSPCSQICSELILINLPCKHSMQIQCFKRSEQHSCPVPCSAVLKCGHSCKGTCGACFGGRVHMACKMRCGRTLVCGHECSNNCDNCPPCEKMCRRKCKHAKCNYPCWEECVPCKEKCSWKCEHFSCSKLCGERCDRPRCNNPCKETLRCKHPCVGLCGEKCPRLCRKCDKDELCEIFFGREDEEDARFIELECKHVIEVDAMDNYMDQILDTIQPKGCPMCKQLINSLQRYGNRIKENCAEVDAVKRKIAGQQKSFRIKAETLCERLSEHRWIFDRISQNALDMYVKYLHRNSRLDMFHAGKTLLHFLDELNELELSHEYKYTKMPDNTFDRMLQGYHMWIVKIIKKRLLLDNEREEFSAEIEHFRLFVHFSALKQNSAIVQLQNQQEKSKVNDENIEMSPFDVHKEIAEIDNLFESGKVLSDEEVGRIKSTLTKSKSISKLPGISEAERKMVVAAMGFKPGHWYKCPNGHVYAIGDCGGAMVKSNCPECHVDIGGANHQLTAGNDVATEMDGSKHAAWSEAANMDNYNLQIFMD